MFINSEYKNKAINISSLKSKNVSNSIDNQKKNEIENTTEPEDNSKDGIIRETLKALGFNPNKENIELANLLLKNNFPVTKETMQNINHAVKLAGSSHSDKSIFFMNNDIKPNTENLTVLNSILDKTSNIERELSNMIFDIITKLPTTEANDILGLSKNNIIDNSIKNNLTQLDNKIKDFLTDTISNLHKENFSLNEETLNNNHNLTDNDTEILNIIKKLDKEEIQLIKNSFTSEYIKDNNQEDKTKMEQNLLNKKNVDLQNTLKDLYYNNDGKLKELSNLLNSRSNIISTFLEQLRIKIEPDINLDLEKNILQFSEKLQRVNNNLTEKVNIQKEIKLTLHNIKNNIIENLNNTNADLSINNSLKKEISSLVSNIINKLPIETANNILEPLVNNTVNEFQKEAFINLSKSITDIIDVAIKQNQEITETITKETDNINPSKENISFEKESIIKDILDKLDTNDIKYIKEKIENNLSDTKPSEVEDNKEPFIRKDHIEFELKEALNIIFKNNTGELKKFLSLLNLKSNTLSKFTKSLRLNKSLNSEDDIKELIKTISDNIEKTQKAVDENTSNTKEVQKNSDTINNTLNFSSLLKNTFFVSIPISINNNNSELELYVFKDNKKKQGQKQSSSALISLNLVALGHLETYVQNYNNNISCQFRIENDKIKKIITQNIQSLNDGLKKHNYTLDNISFKEINEPFTLLCKEPTFNKVKHREITNFSIDTQA